MNRSAPKLIFFVAVDWFFCSHFIKRAVAARNAGYEVLVLTHVEQHREIIESAGIRVIALPINRRSLNPFTALATLLRVYQVYRREKPMLVHHVALKPILFGGLAARLAGVPSILNAIVGGGYLFASQKLLIRIMLPLLKRALRLLINQAGTYVVFENADDLTTFLKDGVVTPSNSVLIRGAGVDIKEYSNTSVPTTPPIVLVTARLLWDKGIGDFVEAARLLRSAGSSARFVIVGSTDPGNRASIDEATLAAWRKEGVVEFWGFRTDIPNILAQSSIACLPSYREGLPKSLLEAMAAGLPCVTTDVPGCREAVRHGDNGILVPPRNRLALANALTTLLGDAELRKSMGLRGRERVQNEFSSELVINHTLALYQKMLSG